jgi:DNA polymerase alpha subunit A
LWSHTLKSNRAERTEYLLLHEFHRLKFLPPEKRKGKMEKKAKYSGGLVLEPKKGLYDSFILLLDFNSLYPSIIQEYNLCFTTMDWSNYVGEEEQQSLPPLPDESVERGVLPRVIQTLVERRRAVKKIMKSETNPEKKQEVSTCGELLISELACLTVLSSTFVKWLSS